MHSVISFIPYHGSSIYNDIYVNNDWTDMELNTPINVENKTLYYGHNAFSTINAAKLKAENIGINNARLIIQPGADAYPGGYFDNIATVIEGGSFSKNVYGGLKCTGSGDRNVIVTNPLIINDGNFKLTCGGSLVQMNNNTDTVTFKGRMNLIINGGSFPSYILASVGKVVKGHYNHIGNINIFVNGGQFDAGFCCSVLHAPNTGSNPQDAATLITGNLFLTITGGKFKEGTFLYGGSASSKKEQSYSSQTTIDGNICITIDGGKSNFIQLSNIVVGSHGYGVITGNARLIFKGSGTNINFVGDKVELWGGCSGDNEKVYGDILLSFEGFIGDLNVQRIRAFKSIQLINNSVVGLTETTVNINGVENWTFENGSSLSGNFTINFTSSAFKFIGSSKDFTSACIISDGTTLNGFAYEEDGEGNLISGFSSVKLFNQTATWNTNLNAYVSTNYKLYIKTGIGMVVEII